MFTVIITEKGGEQRRQDFDKPEVTIGRVQGNDIILPKGNVSKRHSRIVFKDGKFIIVDLKSTNGTYVNGRKITSPLVIKESDKVYIGDFILTVEEGAGAMTGAGSPQSSLGSTGSNPHLAANTPSPMAPSGSGGHPSHPNIGMGGPPVPNLSPAHGSPAMAGGQMAGDPLGGRKSIPPPPARRPVAPAAAPSEDIPINMDDAPQSAPPPPPRQQLERPTVPRAVQAKPTVDPNRISGQRPAMMNRGTLDGVGHGPPGPPGGPNRDPLAMTAQQAAANNAAGRGLAATRPPIATATSAAAPPVHTATSAAAAAVAHHAPPHAAPMAPPVAQVVPPPSVIPVAPLDPRLARALELQRDIHARVAAQLDLARVPIDRLAEEALWQRAETAIVDVVEQLEGEGAIPSFIDQDALIKDSLNEVLGLGPLEDLLADEQVSDVLVNRPDRVLVDRGGQLVPYDKGFSSDTALRQVIARMVHASEGGFDDGLPFVDVRLRDGARLSAALPPMAVRGACLTLRKPRRVQWTLDDLVRGGTMSNQMAEFLATCVAARRNILIVGGAGAGKTTLLGALAAAVPAHERLITLEDVAELALARDSWIALETRPGGDGRLGVGMKDLLGAAQRLLADRIFVGDVRGPEVFELITLLASARDGAAVTLAAEGTKASLARLEGLARLGAGDASPRAVRDLVGQAVHVVVHLLRYADGHRRVTSIAEVLGPEGEGLAVRDLFQFHVQGHGPDGTLRGRFLGAGIVPRFYELLEARGISADPQIFSR